jgi:hypothetical protein
MAIVNKKGIINLYGLDQDTLTMPNAKTSKGVLRVSIDTVGITSTDADGSTYRLARVPSNAVLESITIKNEAITGGTDFFLGFYDINDGAAIDADALLGTTSLASAGDIDGLGSINIANFGKEVWELAGLTEDPYKLVDIVLTGNTVGTATGTVTAIVKYTL